ncbi:MAG: hypothetical protein HFJ60_08920 [Clostridia bacterium]|nr:hypothetical protein [Clostridia bacterium]
MNYFIFKDIDSRSIEGLIVQELPPISKPAKKADKIEIDGRDGDIIEEKGYQAYDKTISIGLTKKYNINQIISWLNGTGKLTMSNEPNKYYNANIIEQIDFERLVRFKTAKIKFHCQPFKHKANEEYLLIKDRKDKTFSGENIGLNDSADMRLQELKICGNSRQEEITENLINNDWDQGGINDITGIEQTDTTKIRSDFIEVHSNNLYSIKRDVFNLYMAYRFYDKDKKYLGDQLTEAMLSSDKEDNRMNTNESSMTFTILNKNVRYMRIIDASNNLNTKYTLTTEARKPSYPSKIESCGDNVNLFDKDNAIILNAYVENTNNKIINSNTERIIICECKANTTYTISKNVKTNLNRFRIDCANKRPVLEDTVTKLFYNNEVNNATITTTEDAKYLILQMHSEASAETVTREEVLNSIKIEVGSTPTPYSKFEQGNISFEMCNKNRFDKNNTRTGFYYTIAGQIGTSLNWNISNIKTKPNQKYSISGNTVNNTTAGFVELDNDLKIIKVIGAYKNTSNFTTSENCAYIGISVPSYIDGRGDDLDSFQIEEGETTDYEEHKSQTYTIPTQKSFRKIDTYKDTFIRKNGKRYERHFGERYIFDGTEEFAMMSDSNETISRFTTRKHDMKNSSVLMCSHFKVIKQSELTAEETISIRDISKDNIISIIILNSRLSNVSVEGFKAWLASKYNSGTPVYIDYVLAEPEDIECTEEQIEILDKIDNEAKTYKNITHIYSTDEVSTILEGTYFTTTNEKIENEGNIQSRPILRLEKIISESVELTINNIRFKYNFNNDEYVEIDCEEKTVKYEGLNRNRNISIGYDFPKLNIGDNNIIMHDGDCIIKILRKDRWL